MNNTFERLVAGDIPSKKVLTIGVLLSVALSFFLFGVFYFLDLSEMQARKIEVIRYVYVFIWGALLFKSSRNVQSKFWGLFYKFLSLLLMLGGVLTLVLLLSNQPNMTQAFSLGSLSQVLKEVQQEQAVEAQRKQSRYYDLCRREAEREAISFEEYTKEEWDRYEKQYGDLIDDCLYRNENKKKICIDSFNKLYFDQGLDPDLYDNIRVEEVQRCLEGKPYR